MATVAVPRLTFEPLTVAAAGGVWTVIALAEVVPPERDTVCVLVSTDGGGALWLISEIETLIAVVVPSVLRSVSLITRFWLDVTKLSAFATRRRDIWLGTGEPGLRYMVKMPLDEVNGPANFFAESNSETPLPSTTLSASAPYTTTVIFSGVATVMGRPVLASCTVV